MAAAVSQNFYSKGQWAAITMVAYLGLTLLVTGIIIQYRLDIFSTPHPIGIKAATLIGVGSAVLVAEVAVLSMKSYLNKNGEKVKKVLSDNVVDPIKDGILDGANYAVDLTAEVTDSGIETFDNHIGQNLKEAALLTWRYVKDNKIYLFGYVLAWAVIVLGLGLLHGFEKTSLPLTIGMAGGFVLGVGVGVITIKSVPHNFPQGHEARAQEYRDNGAQHYIDHYSLWGITSKWLNTLDENGTRMIILSVLVTVLMTFTPIFPIPLGVLIMSVCANALLLQIRYYKYTLDYPTPTKDEKFEREVGREVRRVSVAHQGGAVVARVR